MTKKEQFPYDPKHIAIPLEKAIGERIVCEDGKRRKVNHIVHSAGAFQFAVINEDIEAGVDGHLVHLLKLFCQLRKVAPPTSEEIAKFDEIAKSFDFEYPGQSDKGVFERPKFQAQNKHSKAWFVNKEGKS